jgi:flavin reductase (DIM6/NTAB) family NADH-FMN oxidoreductase RutF
MRDLRREHAAAVTVVTYGDTQGYRGITASAFQILSLAPALVSICLGRGSDAERIIQQAGGFAVSLLSDRQEFRAEQFAGRAPLVNPRFAGVAHHLTRSGLPVLDESLAWFDCRVTHGHPVGDHVLIVGEVQEAGYGTGPAPLLYYQGAYRTLG